MITEDSTDPDVLFEREKRKEQKILSFLGLATRAGRTVSGTDAVAEAISRECAYLVLVAKDASEGTAEKIAFLSRQSGISFCRFSSREQLGKFMGKDDRAVAAVTDEGFADRLIQLLQDGYEVIQASE
jgi:ribosomal protein L7Ae-like RNA K-turn-binding protein